MDGDRALAAYGVLVPDQLVNLAGRKDAVGVSHEQMQDVVLDRRQADRLAVDGDGLRRVVELHAAYGYHVLLRLRLHAAAEAHIAPQVAPHAGLHLDGVEGLRHVVVRAHVEAQHLVGELALGRQQYDGDVELLAQPGRGREAVHLRHHDVHEHEVDIVLPYALQRLTARRGRKELIVRAREVNLERRDYVGVVVANEYLRHIPHLMVIVSEAI